MSTKLKGDIAEQTVMLKTMLLLFKCIFIGLVFHSCSIKETDTSNIDTVVEEYYQVFDKRQDFERFIGFYDENIVLEDIINGDKIIGKKALSSFFDWDNPNFTGLESNTLIISEKIIRENQAVVKGHFTRFKWGQTEFEAMHFTTILTFNDSGKIVKQVDWINYPATLVNYNERKNSNEWIK